MSRNPDERSEFRDLPLHAPLVRRSAHVDCVLRGYAPHDEDAAIALWQRTWQAAYPQIDFAERLAWWRERWRSELVASAEIMVAQSECAIVGFVTVEPRSLYLDQLVVAPEHWGSGVGGALLDRAKRLSPSGLDLDVNTDNARALRFYQKHGFSIGGTGVNPISGNAVHRMSWRP